MGYKNAADQAAYIADYQRRVLGRGGGDLDAVFAHLDLLAESGMTEHRFGQLANLSQPALRNLWQRRSSRVTRKVAERVLAVRPGDLGEGARIPRERVDPVVDELRRRGWTMRQLGEALGWQREFRLQKPTVRGGTFDALRRLLADTPDPDARQKIADEAQRQFWRDQQNLSRQERGMTVRALQDTLDVAPWRTRSACRDRNLTAVFLSSDKQNVERAKRICGGCDVRADCLSWALDTKPNDDFLGVCGGTTEDERVQLRKQRRKASA